MSPEVDLLKYQSWKTLHRMFVDRNPIPHVSDVETLWACCALKELGSIRHFDVLWFAPSPRFLSKHGRRRAYVMVICSI